MARRPAEDDDGRVVASMEGLTRPPILMPRLDDSRKPASPEPPASQPREQLDRAGRRAMLGGTLSAALLIGLVFAAAFAALILLIRWIWS